MTTESSFAGVRKGRTDTGHSQLFSGMLGKENRHDDRGWVEAALTGSFDRFQTVDRDDEGSSGQRAERAPAMAPEYIEADRHRLTGAVAARRFGSANFRPNRRNVIGQACTSPAPWTRKNEERHDGG